MKPEDVLDSSGNVFTDLGLRVCGNCEFHSQEGDDGLGICTTELAQKTSVKYKCDLWQPRADEQDH